MARLQALLFRVLKPIIKMVAIRIIQQEGDRLQARVKERVAERGPGEIDRIIDKVEVALKARLLNLPFLPESVRREMDRLLTEHAERLRSRLTGELAAKGMGAVDAVFDGAQALLIAQIEAL